MLKSIESLLANDSHRSRARGYRRKTLRDYEVFDFLDFVKGWSLIVGEKLAHLSRPLKIQRGTLFIQSSHGLYAQQMDFMSRQIIELIHRNFPKLRSHVKRIKFVVKHLDPHTPDPQAPTQRKAQHHRFNPQFLEMKAVADKEFSHIEDQETQQLLKSLFIQKKIRSLDS